MWFVGKLQASEKTEGSGINDLEAASKIRHLIDCFNRRIGGQFACFAFCLTGGEGSLASEVVHNFLGRLFPDERS
jgi:hypothetical protein